MSEPPTVTDLPAPSAELMVLLALMLAQMRMMSRKERERFLRDIADGLGVQAAAYNVVPLRAVMGDPAVAKAAKEAQAWFHRAVLVAMRLK